MKQILFIEDNPSDFDFFSKLLRDNSYSIHPAGINSDESLLRILGFEQFTPTMDANTRLNIIRNSIYNYITNKQHKLYSTLSAIILDINLLIDVAQDKTGLRFMEDFRNSNNLDLPEQYKQWNKVIPIVALTKYPISKYEDEFMKHPGYLAKMFNKEDVRNNNSVFFETLNNFHEQMSAIYPLFLAPELKEILYKINKIDKNTEQLKEIEQLLLWSNIALMDVQKRNAFADNFADELIKYSKENNAFMADIEDIENSFKNEILKLFNSPSIKIMQICSLFGAKINIDKLPDFFDKASELLKTSRINV